MKTAVIKLEGIESVLSPAGVEKKMCQHPSIRRDRRDHIEPRDPWWAAGYNIIAFPIAAGLFYSAFGLILRPEIVAISMSGSSMLMAVNALMLKNTKLEGIQAKA